MRERVKMMRNGVIGSTADSDSVSRGSSPFSVAGNLQKCRFLFYRSVAQLGRALRSGRRGRRFESCHSDFYFPQKSGDCRTSCNPRFLLKSVLLRIFVKNSSKIYDNERYIFRFISHFQTYMPVYTDSFFLLADPSKILFVFLTTRLPAPL